MAKGNLMLGTSRGKIGDVVMYRANGQQMTRVRVRKVANPKTNAQSIQRLVLSSAAKAAQALSFVVDHSFEGVQYGSKSTRYFRSEAMKELRAKFLAALNYTEATGFNTFAPIVPLDANDAAIGEYLISKGSLPSFDGVTYVTCTADGWTPIGLQWEGLQYDDTFGVFKIRTEHGISLDDQITIVMARESGAESVSSDELVDNTFFYARLNFNADANDGLQMWLPYSGHSQSSGFDYKVYRINPAVLDTSRSTNYDHVLLINNTVTEGVIGTTWQLVVLPANMGTLVSDADFSSVLEDYTAAAVIRSRYEDGTWLRSTEHLRTFFTSGLVSYGDHTPADEYDEYEEVALMGYNQAWDVLNSVYALESASADWLLNKKLTAAGGQSYGRQNAPVRPPVQHTLTVSPVAVQGGTEETALFNIVYDGASLTSIDGLEAVSDTLTSLSFSYFSGSGHFTLSYDDVSENATHTVTISYAGLQAALYIVITGAE